MSDGPKCKGISVALTDGRSVALFCNVVPGAHSLCFTCGEQSTEIVLNDEALTALTVLLTRNGEPVA